MHLRTFLARLTKRPMLHPIRGCFSSMDVNIHGWARLFVEPTHQSRWEDLLQIPRNGINSMDDFIDPSITLPTGGDLQNCVACAANLQSCTIMLASHKRHLVMNENDALFFIMFYIIIMALNAENHGWSSSILTNLHLRDLSVRNMENKELNLHYQW